MSDKEKFNLAEAVKELATLTDGCERRATGLLIAVAELSALLETPKETPRADGGRPLRHVHAVWEDAVDMITAAQATAAACANDVLTLLPEIEYCAKCADDDEPREEYEAARRTLAQYADEIQAAKEKQRAAENRAGELADIYNHLFTLAIDLLSPEDREKHQEFTEKRHHPDK